jgi:phasin family protein
VHTGAFDMTAFQDAQKKNMSALIEANKVAVGGYQQLYKRLGEQFEAALAETKDHMNMVQGQPMNAESAEKAMDTMKTTFEKALADIKELAEMANSANTDAFEIIKARTEEVMADIKAVTEKLAA